MVVSLLALLFVIVVGFLNLARFERLSFQDVQRGNEIERVVDAVNQLVLSEMRNQWTDPNGMVLPGAPNARAMVTWEDIPGFRGARYQASIDPVADPNQLLDANLDLPPPYDLLGRTRYAAISSLIGTDAPLQPRVVDLMLDGDPNIIRFGRSDVIANARSAFMDADGDGVPDSSVMAAAPATHLANAIAQRPARLPGLSFTPHHMIKNPGDPEYNNYLLWKRFEETARYEVAVRVVPHGGMVALDVPRDPNGNRPWNREFAVALFNALRRDANSLRSDADTLLDDLKAEAAAVEAVLRRRGGLLPSWAPAEPGKPRDPNLARVPEVLRLMEKTFPATLDVGRSGGFGPGLNRKESWQRFNLGEEESSLQAGIRTWFPAARVDATAFNRGISRGSDHVGNYDRRHLLTLFSTSDEQARRLAADATSSNPLGLRHGQRKFYLGRVAEAFNPQTGYFDPNTGQQIILELAKYYRDMLGAHEFDPNELPPDADQPDQQAYMLAVNTVAFAAPRRPNNAPDPGFVDIPVLEPGATQNRWLAGYGPQPYITQVIVYNSEEDPNEPEKLAALVELFNPNDPTDYAGVDQQALFAPQFAITLNDHDPQLGGFAAAPIIPGRRQIGDRTFVWPPPSQPDRIQGRSFFSLVIHDGSNAELEQLLDPNQPHGFVRDYPVELKGINNDELTVRLWRRDARGRWFLVDKFEVVAEAKGNQQYQTSDFWEVAWRDCNTEAYFGPDASVPAARAARWRMVVPWKPADQPYRRAGGTGFPGSKRIGLGMTLVRDTISRPDPEVRDPNDPSSKALQFGPTVPLYTMNATPLGTARNRLMIHGAPRPESFPTPGFLLFVPRFCHLRDAAQVPRAMGEILRDYWEKRNRPSIPLLPADFGHMPVFENRQKVKSNSYLDNGEAGKVPWGLLVFDYFTTLDPNTPGLDTDQVPGRININAAPWLVLAQLPIIGPNPQTGNAPLPPAASPAFRWIGSGILFGRDRAGIDRFIGYENGQPRTFGSKTRLPAYNPTMFGSSGSYQLNAWLAQAAAAYRDGLRYVSEQANSNGWMYSTAFARNSGAPGGLRYRSPDRYGRVTEGDGIRGEPNNALAPSKFGYLSIGELVNVLGFDSTPPDAIARAASGTRRLDQDVDATLGDGTGVRHGDFMKAAALTALLDSHFLTTRGNTFTVYVSVMDRENPQASVRSQLTVDRSNLLPRLVHVDSDNDGLIDVGEYTTTIQSQTLPAVIAQRRSGYYNARYDD